MFYFILILAWYQRAFQDILRNVPIYSSLLCSSTVLEYEHLQHLRGMLRSSTLLALILDVFFSNLQLSIQTQYLYRKVYMLQVYCLINSQTEHIHVIGTQVKKQNIPASQKPQPPYLSVICFPLKSNQHPGFVLYINRTIKYVVFCVWVLLLNIKFLRSSVTLHAVIHLSILLYSIV